MDWIMGVMSNFSFTMMANLFMDWVTGMLGIYSFTMVAGFFAVIMLFLYIDLNAHKADAPIDSGNAWMWSGIWIGISLCFAGYIAYAYGSEKASMFLAGYFLEKSLSVDNLFVIMAIFSSFAISDKYQHRVLYWGILGALVLRMLFVAFGTTLASMSEWVLLGFGLFVLWTAYKMATTNEAAGEIKDYSNHRAVRLTRKIFPIYPKIDSHNFFVRHKGVLSATPLFLALVCVEISDVAFAFDSVPAVIAVTRDPMLVYTSNIFAILGLRSLYFVLVAAKNQLVHLEKAVVGILVFIGVKMIAGTFGLMHLSPNVSLLIVIGGLTMGIVASLVFPKVEPALAKAKA